MKFRAWLGWHLRRLADRIDDEHAFVSGVGYFNFVKGKGLVITAGGSPRSPHEPGTRLYYVRNEIDDAHQ